MPMLGRGVMAQDTIGQQQRPIMSTETEAALCCRIAHILLMVEEPCSSVASLHLQAAHRHDMTDAADLCTPASQASVGI